MRNNMSVPSITPSEYLQSTLKAARLEQHFTEKSNSLNEKNKTSFQTLLDELEVKNPCINNKTFLPKKVNQLQSHPSINEFVQSIWDKAKQAAALIGVDPKILVAQVALETGWGRLIAKDADGKSSNNLFNIKSKSASEYDSVLVKTKEYVTNQSVTTIASFKKYPSIEHSFNDYVVLIKDNARYQAALTHAGNPEAFCNELQKAGYATDPNYSKKILSIYYSEELTQAMSRLMLQSV